MRKFNRLLILALPFLLISCGDDKGDPSSSTPSDSISDSENPSTEDSSEDYSKWSEDQKMLLENYAGAILPYPSGFANEVSFEVITDEASASTYLQILAKSEKFSIASYYESLLKSEWSLIRDYNGKAEQSDAKGNAYYELVKIDDGFGYLLTYFHYEGEKESYDVIQCYNDFDTELDNRTSWTEEEQEKYRSALTEVPPFMKLGERNAVVSDGTSRVYCLDMLSKDLSKENAAILVENGYVLDTETSASHGNFVLVKTFEDGSTIYASTYYYSGNYVTFSYGPKIYESSSWLSELTASFEEKTGYQIPQFEANKYYGYVKDGVTRIYCYTDNFYIDTQYERALLQSGIIYDNTQGFYADWAETYYLKPFTYFDADGNTVFGVDFSLLEAPYDTIENSWPSDKIQEFLKENSISGSVPEFDFSSLSPHSTCHTSVTNYSTAYEEAYAKVKASPSSYGLKEDDEDGIKEAAEQIARQNTVYTIRIYDPEVRIDETKTEFKVNEAFFALCKKEGMSRVSSNLYDIAMEDEEGRIAIGIDLNHQEVTIISITYGSNQSHDPIFRFDEESLTLNPGSVYKLRYTCEGYPYEVKFSSSNSKVKVDSEGMVTVDTDAEPGSEATITASMEIPSEGTLSITCKILIAENYTDESAIKAVAKKYNDHFSLSEGNVKYASPEHVSESDVEEGTVISYWNFDISTSLASIAEAQGFIETSLIPAGFLATGKWEEGQFEDGTANQTILYSTQNANFDTITLFYSLYLDSSDNSVHLKVISTIS